MEHLKILIVKIGAVGDTVMALSMLEAIDRKWPGAHVTWVCGEAVAPLVKAPGRVNEVVVLNDRKLLRGGVGGALSVLVPLWFKLLGRKFDLVLSGHSDPRYGLLSATVMAYERRSFGKGRGGPVPGRYHGDEYVRLVTDEDGPEAFKARIPSFKFEPAPALQNVLSAGGNFVALAPGGAKNILRDDALRRWPLENYVRLAELLVKNGNKVLLTGGPGDEWVREAFQKTPFIDLIGKTSLMDLVALYGKCALVVTHDSGPLHLAMLAGAPVLALFGPTDPVEKVPANGKNLVLWGGEELACRPCYDGKNYAACSNNLCLKSVTVEKVHQEALRLLKKT